MIRVLPVILLVFLIVYSVLDVAQTESDEDRLGLPKWLWVTLIIVTSGGCAIIWLIVKFAINPRRNLPPEPRPGPSAPDDDPDFLFRLQQQMRRERKAEEEGEIDPPTSES